MSHVYGNFLNAADPIQIDFYSFLNNCVAKLLTKHPKYSILYDLYHYIDNYEGDLKALYTVDHAVPPNYGMLSRNMNYDNITAVDLPVTDIFSVSTPVTIDPITIGNSTQIVGWDHILLNFDDDPLIYADNAGTLMVHPFVYNIKTKRYQRLTCTNANPKVVNAIANKDLYYPGVGLTPGVQIDNNFLAVRNTFNHEATNIDELLVINITDFTVKRKHAAGINYTDSLPADANEFGIPNQPVNADVSFSIYHSTTINVHKRCAVLADLVTPYTKPSGYFTLTHLKLLLSIKNRFSNVSNKIEKYIKSLNLTKQSLINLIRTADSRFSGNKIGNFVKDIFPTDTEALITEFIRQLAIQNKCTHRFTISFLRGFDKLNFMVYNVEQARWKDKERFKPMMYMMNRNNPAYAKNYMDSHRGPDRIKLLWFIGRDLQYFRRKFTFGEISRPFRWTPRGVEPLAGGLGDINIYTLDRYIANQFIKNAHGSTFDPAYLNSIFPLTRSIRSREVRSREILKKIYMDTPAYATDLVTGILGLLPGVHLFTFTAYRSKETELEKETYILEKILINRNYSYITEPINNIGAPIITVAPPIKNRKHYMRVILKNFEVYINIWYLVDKFGWTPPAHINRRNFVL